MPRLAGNQALAFPPARFQGGTQINGLALPQNIPNGVTQRFPNPAFGIGFDFAGYNTLSFYMELSALPGGNTVTVWLQTIDPEDTVSNNLGSNLGRTQLLVANTTGPWAATLFLPTLYATLVGKVAPFFSNRFEMLNAAGAGNATVSVLKYWLTNASSS